MHRHRTLGPPALRLKLVFKTTEPVLKRRRILEGLYLLRAVNPSNNQPEVFVGGVKPSLDVQCFIRSRIRPYHGIVGVSTIGVGPTALYRPLGNQEMDLALLGALS